MAHSSNVGIVGKEACGACRSRAWHRPPGRWYTPSCVTLESCRRGRSGGRPISARPRWSDRGRRKKRPGWEALHLAGGDGAVAAEPCDEWKPRLAWRTRLETNVFPRGSGHADAADRPPACRRRTAAPYQGVCAAAAADMRLDDLNIRQGRQRLSHDTADDMGIWVEDTTTAQPISPRRRSSRGSQCGECCTVGVSYQPSTLMSPGSWMAA